MLAARHVAVERSDIVGKEFSRNFNGELLAYNRAFGRVVAIARRLNFGYITAVRKSHCGNFERVFAKLRINVYGCAVSLVFDNRFVAASVIFVPLYFAALYFEIDGCGEFAHRLYGYVSSAEATVRDFFGFFEHASLHFNYKVSARPRGCVYFGFHEFGVGIHLFRTLRYLNRIEIRSRYGRPAHKLAPRLVYYIRNGGQSALGFGYGNVYGRLCRLFERARNGVCFHRYFVFARGEIFHIEQRFGNYFAHVLHVALFNRYGILFSVGNGVPLYRVVLKHKPGGRVERGKFLFSVVCVAATYERKTAHEQYRANRCYKRRLEFFHFSSPSKNFFIVIVLSDTNNFFLLLFGKRAFAPYPLLYFQIYQSRRAQAEYYNKRDCGL